MLGLNKRQPDLTRMRWGPLPPPDLLNPTKRKLSTMSRLAIAVDISAVPNGRSFWWHEPSQSLVVIIKEAGETEGGWRRIEEFGGQPFLR